MIRRVTSKAKIMALFLVCAILLAGCSVNYDQAAQALEIMADNVDQNTKTDEVSAKEEPADKDKTAEDTQTPSAGEEEEPKVPDSDIYILFTSDVHCGVDQGFGYAALKQIRDNLESQGCVTLLVDDGDFVQGESIGTLSRGEAIIPIMNALHYDIVIPGNHEFDYGMDEFLKYSELADFPIISCNINKEGKLLFDPYVIKDVAGLKIAFVGVTTPTTLVSDAPDAYKDENGNYIYGFMQGNGSELYKAVQKAVDDARAEGADLVYVMGHLGCDLSDSPYTYMDVVSNTTGIDVFLDGHSHDDEQVVMKNKNGEDVVRSACGTKLNAIGYSHIKAKDGSIDTNIWKWPNKDALPGLLGIKNDITDLIDSEMGEVDEQLKEVVAKSDTDLVICDPAKKDDDGDPVRIIRVAETNLGDLCADAARVRTGADIGVVNGGGVRDKIDKGDITYGDIIAVHPFNNKTVIIEVTGQQMMDALEWSVSKLPEEDGGFLQVSGISFDVDVKVKSGCTTDVNGLMTGIDGDRRVSNVKVGGKPIDPDAKYTVAGNAFILTQNGNGYTSFDGAKVIAEDAGLDNQLLIDYIVETLGGTVGKDYEDPYGQGRIEIND